MFHFDNAKSQADKAKYGIDFVEAQELWRDLDLLEVRARTQDEPRYLIIGMLEGRHWSAVVTYRGSNIRIISVRRARVRVEEVALYKG